MAPSLCSHQPTHQSAIMAQLEPNSWSTIGGSGFIIRLRDAGNAGLMGVRGSLEDEREREGGKRGLQSKTPTFNTFLSLEFWDVGVGIRQFFITFLKNQQSTLPLLPEEGNVSGNKQGWASI